METLHRWAEWMAVPLVSLSKRWLGWQLLLNIPMTSGAARSAQPATEIQIMYLYTITGKLQNDYDIYMLDARGHGEA